MIISVFSFDPHNNSVEVNKKGLVIPFYRRGNEGKREVKWLAQTHKTRMGIVLRTVALGPVGRALARRIIDPFRFPAVVSSGLCHWPGSAAVTASLRTRKISPPLPGTLGPQPAALTLRPKCLVSASHHAQGCTTATTRRHLGQVTVSKHRNPLNWHLHLL